MLKKKFPIIFIGGGFPKFYHLINKILIQYFDPNTDVYTDDLNLKEVFKTETFYIGNIYYLTFKVIFYLIFFIPYLIIIVPIILYYKNKKYVTKNWFLTQLLHSFWDISLVTMKNDCIQPPLINQFNALRTVFVSIYMSLFLKIKGINTIILGHSVYHSRVLMAFFRLFDCDIYNFANWNYHYQFKKNDNAWWYIDDLNSFNVSSKTANDYFIEKNQGKGKSAEDLDKNFENTSKKNIIKQSKINLPKNVIFLHIFKDSPFNVIDETRIFKDYFDWIENTLLILSNSSEKWSLRTHPSSARWGEDQLPIINKILNKVQNKIGFKLKNIIVENSDQRTSLDLLKEAKKIISFNGTIHVESACFGVKPIIISKCMMSELGSNFVFKPSTLDEYRELILSNDINFRLNTNEINISRKYLFIRENYLSFNSVLNALYLYRGDSLDKVDLAFKILKKNLSKNKKLIEINAKKLFSHKSKNTSNLI